jgi:hypothetical protein
VAFDAIKDAISNSLTLHWMNEEDPIILYTDASLLGLGAMLVQDQKGEEVPLMFVSKKFTPTQRNWSTIEQEAFAIFYSILQLQSFLLNRHFFVKTDHRNLVYLSTSVVPKVIRWRLRLLEYRFTVVHIPGVSNVVADTISRSFAVDLGAEVQSQSHVVAAPVTEKDQQLLIRSMHNELVGHHGIEKTMHILKEAGFGWDGMRQMVKEMISNCLVCQKIKYHAHVPLATWHNHLHGDYPMKAVSIDTLGPLPMDRMGNQYILVILDDFSKFAELFAVASTATIEYVKCLVSHIGLFGLMKQVRTDGGSQFTSTLSSELSQLIGFEHVVIAPYHPQANGLVERKNAEVMKHLRALVLTRKVHAIWSSYLPLVQRILKFTNDATLKCCYFGKCYVVSYDQVPINTFLQELKSVQ